METLIRDFWHVLLAIAGVIVFAIRHEGKTIFHGAEIKRLQDQRDDDLRAAKEQRDEDQRAAMLSRGETHQMLRDIATKLDRLVERMLPKG